MLIKLKLAFAIKLSVFFAQNNAPRVAKIDFLRCVLLGKKYYSKLQHNVANFGEIAVSNGVGGCACAVILQVACV